MRQKPAKNDPRTPEQIRQHYEVEKELAGRLRQAPRQERRLLYAALYDELFRRVPQHPQLTRKKSPTDTARAVAEQMKLLGPFLTGDTVCIEIGSGDCSLSFEIARHVKKIYAIDVSVEITGLKNAPPNFQFILSDGCSIPVPPGSAQVAYSNQLMEHLHPDDALEQLHNIYSALASGGSYICSTPSSLTGPHDISKYFDARPTGFHLKEYTASELYRLFKKAGFSKVRAYVNPRGTYERFPVTLLRLCEWVVSRLPRRVRQWLVCRPRLRIWLNARLISVK